MPKVLLVEDNAANADMLMRRLMRRGFEVVHLETGEHVVEVAERETPDVILMDVSLPGMDGYAVTRALKANAKTGGIPVIILTAHAMALDRQASVQAGGDDFETKPIDFARLVEKIERLMVLCR